MALAQLIRFDERQAIGRPRRAIEKPVACVILQLRRPPVRRKPVQISRPITPDEDKIAGRGRDPG